MDCFFCSVGGKKLSGLGSSFHVAFEKCRWRGGSSPRVSPEACRAYVLVGKTGIVERHESSLEGWPESFRGACGLSARATCRGFRQAAFPSISSLARKRCSRNQLDFPRCIRLSLHTVCTRSPSWRFLIKGKAVLIRLASLCPRFVAHNCVPLISPYTAGNCFYFGEYEYCSPALDDPALTVILLNPRFTVRSAVNCPP